MATVLARRYNNFQYDHFYDFSGRTDQEIIGHLLQNDNRDFSVSLIQEILAEFCIELEKEIKNGQPPEIHPGVKRLLRTMGNTENIFLGLVTGNVSEGARIKLEAVDMQHYFPIGGFGDDSKDRNDLPPIAKKRAEKYFKRTFKSDDIWIIGDSIYDIVCAQENYMRCLAVSTGKTSKEKLAASNPEFLVDDLSDLEKIQKILVES
jgi:phosphoglycolate phosphatase-like HAD superfamily hydrolase